MSFKDELKALRKQYGMTQTDLAKKMGVVRSAVSMWESGAREPSFETLEAIADCFNVSMSRLLPDNKRPTTEGGSGPNIISIYWSLSQEDREIVDSMILRLSAKARK